MAIAIEYISLVVPIQSITEKYPGGWRGFVEEHAKLIGKIVWYDSYLCHAGGAMDSGDIDSLIDKWEKLGFEATEIIGEKRIWKDFCVFSSYGGSNYTCPWLCIDPGRRIAWLADTEPGLAMSRDDFRSRTANIFRAVLIKITNYIVQNRKGHKE